jgi:hypothetical protein
MQQKEALAKIMGALPRGELVPPPPAGLEGMLGNIVPDDPFFVLTSTTSPGKSGVEFLLDVLILTHEDEKRGQRLVCLSILKDQVDSWFYNLKDLLNVRLLRSENATTLEITIGSGPGWTMTFQGASSWSADLNNVFQRLRP